MAKKEEKSILNRGPLNEAIAKAEEIISPFDVEERGIIVDHMKSRIIAETQKNKESDVMQRTMDNLPMGLGKLMKRTGKEFEDEE